MKLNKYFLYIDSEDADLCYDLVDHVWKTKKECGEGTHPYSPCSDDISTFKAAAAHIRRHDEIPKGTRFKVVNRFVGYDRFVTK